MFRRYNKTRKLRNYCDVPLVPCVDGTGRGRQLDINGSAYELL